MVEKEQNIDLSDDVEIDENYEYSPKEIESLKSNYEETFGDDAQEFSDLKDKRDEEDYVVIKASKQRLKDMLSRTYTIHIGVGEVEVEEEVEKDGKIVKEKVMKESVMPFKIKLPNDKQKIKFEKYGITSVKELSLLSPEAREEAEDEIAKNISRIIIEPKFTAKELREELPESIYKSLYLKILLSSIQTNEARLIDFFLEP